jgi:D-2-hydroxyacid dehydrogenase (NADP+)
MTRPDPAHTKLVICAHHRFSLWNAPPELASRLRQRWPEMNVVHLPHYDALGSEIGDADIYVGFSIRPEQFALARKLKWIHSTAAAVGQLMYPAVRQSGIAVTNARGVHSVPMAEHILGTLVALARRLPDCLRYQQQRRWAQQELWDAPVRPRELNGSVLLFIGFGSIGRATAKLARPLGVRVWAITRSGHADPQLADRIFPASELHAVLAQADFIVLAAPETSATRKLIGAREFAVMKKTAYFMNVARGALVDEAALLAALEEQRIAGAAIDVASEEPLPPENALWKLPNLLITPHISAITGRLWERQADLLMENLDHWFRGRELLNRVDLAREY